MRLERIKLENNLGIGRNSQYDGMVYSLDFENIPRHISFPNFDLIYLQKTGTVISRTAILISNKKFKT